MPTETTESTEEVYKVVYEIHIHFEKDCGVETVIINQTGKPGGDPPPPPPGTGPS